MNYEIHITKRAELDLEEAANYIEFVLKNPDAADALLDKVNREVTMLTDYPKRVPIVDDAILSAWGIRFITVNNYLVFFVIDEAKKHVHIIRFLYGKRDWITILRHGVSLF